MIQYRSETIGEIFKRSPQEALEETFRRRRAKGYTVGKEDDLFCWVSIMGDHGQHRYGSYRNIRRSELEGREFDIEYIDGAVCLYFTDVVLDSKTNKSISKAA